MKPQHNRRTLDAVLYIAAFALIIATLASVWLHRDDLAAYRASRQGSALSSFSEALDGRGTERHPYQIASGEDLARLRELIHAGAATSGVYFEQTQDIVLSVEPWEPIADDENHFSGVYDGRGHSILGLYISGQGQSFFGVLDGTVQNLRFEDVRFYGSLNSVLVDHGTEAYRLVNCIVSGIDVLSGIRNSSLARNLTNGRVYACKVLGAPQSVALADTAEAEKTVIADTLYEGSAFFNMAASQAVSTQSCRRIVSAPGERDAAWCNAALENLADYAVYGRFNHVALDADGGLGFTDEVTEHAAEETAAVTPARALAREALPWLAICALIALAGWAIIFVTSRKDRANATGMTRWFVTLSALSVALTVAALFVSHGELFREIFFLDSLDTGMDFFHSIEYTNGRSPYVLFDTLYPPLANLLFFVLIRFVPAWQYETWAQTFSAGIAARGSNIDLRVWQPTMFMFIVFLAVSSALLILIVQRHFTDERRKEGGGVALCALLSFGILYSYERGNIMILAAECVLFFFLFRNSKNAFLSELSLILLAAAAGLKIYPAVFGLTLLYEKQYRKAIRCVIYGIILFLLPAFAFVEGVVGIRIFLDVLTRFTQYVINASGFSFSYIVNTLAILVCGGVDNIADPALVQAIASRGTLVISAVLAVCGFFMKKDWQKSLVCCTIIFMYQNQGIYATMLYLIPLMHMLREEKVVRPRNLVPFCALILSVALLPITSQAGAAVPLKYFRFQVCQVVFASYIFAETIVQAHRALRRVARADRGR